MIALRKKDPARAIALLKPVADANPSDSATANALARAYLAAGKKDEAVELYQRAAANNPDSVVVQTSAALMRMQFGDPTEGVADLEKIADTDKGADLATPLLVMGDLQRGDVGKAATTAEALVKRQPDDAVALNLLGSVRVAQDRLPEAEKIFTDIISKDRNFLAARRNLAQVYMASSKPDEAKKIWLDLLKDKPDDNRAMMGLADIAIQKQDMREAADRLSQAQENSPRDPTPSARLVQLYAAQHDWNSALNVAQQMEAQFPTNSQVVDIVAGVRLQSGDPAGAAAGFRSLIQRVPESAPLFGRYAFYQRQAGDLEGARTSLRKAIALDPVGVRYMGDLVKLDYDDKGVDGALATANSFAAKQPALADLLASEVLLSAKRVPEAMAVLTHAHQDHPISATEVSLANLTYGSGKRDEAKALLQTWIKGHDSDVAARLALANMLLSEGNNDGAQAIYEQIREMSPNNVMALNNLAWIYAKKRDPRAPDLARLAYRISPSPQTEDTLGWVLMGTGDSGKALTYLKDAGAAMPNDATVQYHLAAALKATGDTAKARSVLEQALKTDANFDGKEDAQKLLDELKRG